MHRFQMRPVGSTTRRQPELPFRSEPHDATGPMPSTGTAYGKSLLLNRCCDQSPDILADKAPVIETGASVCLFHKNTGIVSESAFLCRLFQARQAFAQIIGTHSRFIRQDHPTLKGVAWQGEVPIARTRAQIIVLTGEYGLTGPRRSSKRWMYWTAQTKADPFKHKAAPDRAAL